MDRPTPPSFEPASEIDANPTPKSPRLDRRREACTSSDTVESRRSKTPRPAASGRLTPSGRLAASKFDDAATLYRPITLVYMAAIMFLMVPVLTLVDTSVASFFDSSPLPRDLDSALELSLVFSHGTGVFLVLMTIMLLAPKLRWQVPRLATLALGGGALATITKLFILRPRPGSVDLEYVGSDSAWLWAFDWDLSEIAVFDVGSRAFPSANVVTATALTIGLWIMLPRGRALFATVWCGVLLQRLNTSTHYLSDACGGVAIGFLWAFICYHPKLMGTLFDRMAPEPRRRQQRRETTLRANDSADATVVAAEVHRIRPAAGTESEVHAGCDVRDERAA